MLASHAPSINPLQLNATKHTPRLMFRTVYQWFYLLAALDVLLTSIILNLGGTELNAFACWLFREHGAMGLLLFKAACAGLVVLICEVVGRKRVTWGRGVALFAVGANTVPVTVGLMCVGMFVMAWA